MLVNTNRTRSLLAALSLMIGMATAATAATCDPNQLSPTGLTLRDLSRDSGGFAGRADNTLVYFQICPSTNTVTRTTIAQPFRMGLWRVGCDEVPELDASLKGLYYSVRRMNDSHPNYDPSTDPNRRIGYEYIAGSVVDNKTGAVLGTFEMNGVIGTNTSRKPLPDGIGSCYDCGHHEGYITVRFTDERYKDSAVFAEYHFHTGDDNGEWCDQQDPCEIEFQFYGVVDGIYLSRCAQTATAG